MTAFRSPLAWALWLATLGAAAAAPHAAAPDPLDPQASVPPLVYRSPLQAYRAPPDLAVGDWRAGNDTVGSVGGWRAYAREAQAPDAVPPPPGSTPASAPAAAASSVPKAMPHGSHAMPMSAGASPRAPRRLHEPQTQPDPGRSGAMHGTQPASGPGAGAPASAAPAPKADGAAPPPVHDHGATR